MAKLTYQQRKRLPARQFALEKERKYPLEDITHARNALARVSAFGTESEKVEVRREVYTKYPQLNPAIPKNQRILRVPLPRISIKNVILKRPRLGRMRIIKLGSKIGYTRRRKGRR